MERKQRISGQFVFRRAVDIGMTALIVLLLASQITGQAAHEYLGIALSVLVIVHIVMNRAWYGHLFKGKYRAARTLQTVINLALLVCFALTAVTGMLMSQYAVTFLRAESLVSGARALHLGFSHWTFVLVGAHLGLHWGMMVQPLRKRRALWRILSVAAVIAAGYGMLLSVRAQIYEYMIFRVQFAFLDYGKAPAAVIAENLLMMSSWVLPSFELTQILRKPTGNDPHRRAFSLLMIALEFVIALILSRIIPAY